MAFDVVVTDLAQVDIDEAVQFIGQNSTQAAAKWKAELADLIFSLAEMPTRFAVVPEVDELKLRYRSASHYSHRVIFRIDEELNTVVVVRLYHGKRMPLSEDNL